MEGSVVGVFLGTVIGCYFYLYMMGMQLLPLRLILAYSAVAAVAEGTSPGNLDNLVVPVVLHFSIEKVETLLPA
jgi:dolichol kinase